MKAPYGRCRLCGEPLTKREKRILKDQCWDCTDEISVDVHDE